MKYFYLTALPILIACEVTVYPNEPLRTVPEEMFGSNIEWINPPMFELDSFVTLPRFPGGVFSDAYDWEVPLGVEQEIFPGGFSSHHLFNTDSLMALNRPVLITVNSLSTAEKAAAWVAYIRDNYPGRVPYWEIGNEVYNPDDFAGHLTIDQYIDVVNEFSAAMRAEDPSIKIIGIGALPEYSVIEVSEDWLGRLVSETDIDYVSLHPYNITEPDYLDAVVDILPDGVDIALTEWGSLHSFTESNVNTMGDALTVAKSMVVMMQNPRVKIANFFKVTGDVVGWYKPDGTREPTLLAFFLFYNLDRNLVRVDSELPTLAGPSSVVIVNDTEREVPLRLKGITPNQFISLHASSPESHEIIFEEIDGKTLPPWSITLGKMR